MLLSRPIRGDDSQRNLGSLSTNPGKMDSILNKDIELIKDPKPEQRCSFCYSAV
ncbi:hypothetical protein M8J77_020961, partial [Diaphorina citri]